jgi:molybdopterin molybdotransferase
MPMWWLPAAALRWAITISFARQSRPPARRSILAVAIKPGKPLMVAQRGRQVILGLPGNPAAAFVTGYLFLLPLLRAALGAAETLPRLIPARLAQDMPAGGGRTEFLRARWDGASVTLDPLQDSGALSSLARSNALVRREARAPLTPAGTDVPVYLLENGGIA